MRSERIEPGRGQESVWDYPRPPRIERSQRRVKVVFNAVVIAESDSAVRVCETASPPVYYVPRRDVCMELLTSVDHSSFCEWKGRASYFDLTVNGHTAPRAAWTYERPAASYTELTGHIAFYPGRVDAAFLDDEPVRPQAGDFYGGWITDDVVGPFKGEGGTLGW